MHEVLERRKKISQKDFEEFLLQMQEYGHYLPNEIERIYFRQIMIYQLKVMRATGMRWQEASALKREDIQFETREYLDAEGIKQKKKQL